MTAAEQQRRQVFVDAYIAALRRHGEAGQIEYEAAPYRLVLHGPPVRTRRLGSVYDRWVRLDLDAQHALLDRVAAKRFGSAFATANPDLVTDVNVRQFHAGCCGDEDLVLQRCPNCTHVWLYCYECETWHVDVQVEPFASKQATSALDQADCPRCGEALPQDVDEMLPTRVQVAEAGLSGLLVEGSE